MIANIANEEKVVLSFLLLKWVNSTSDDRKRGTDEHAARRERQPASQDTRLMRGMLRAVGLIRALGPMKYLDI
jgi:hypothetical protein